MFTRKVRNELSRRASRSRHVDPFNQVFGFAREAVLGQPEHAAWAVLDRKRVMSLLAADGSSVDPRGRFQVWRLATVFGRPAG